MSETERFLALLEPHRERLLVLSRSLLRREADADDALQEAILKAWRDFSRYRERNRFGAWIVSYLVNTIRNRNRLLSNELEVPLPEEIEAPDALLGLETSYERFFSAPESILEMVEDRLAEAIRRLSAAERMVLLLRTVGGLSYREVAHVLRMPEGTAMSHLSRARKHVRVFLTELARSEDTGKE